MQFYSLALHQINWKLGILAGLPGFYEFLKILYDESHPEHEDTRAWGEEQGFREYDPEYINM